MGTLTEDGWDVSHTRSNLKIIAGLKVRTAKRFVCFLEHPILLAAVEAVANLGPDQNPDERHLDLLGWANQCGLQANKGVYMGACWSNLTLAGVDVRTLRPDDWMQSEPPAASPAPVSAVSPAPPAPAVPPSPPPAQDVAPPSSPPSAKILPPPGVTTPPDFDPDPLARWRARAGLEPGKVGEKPKLPKKKDGDAEATLETAGDYRYVTVNYKGDVDVEVSVEVTLPGFDPQSWTAKVNGKEANLDHDGVQNGAMVLKISSTVSTEHEDECNFQFDVGGKDSVDYLPLRRIVELAYRQDPTLCRQLAAEFAAQGYGTMEAVTVPEDVVRNGGRA